MYLINRKNENNEIIPISHKCDEADIGKSFTKEDLHTFAIEMMLVYFYNQGGDIISINMNLGIDYPHIVVKNQEKDKYFYITIKAGFSPNIPEPLQQEHYSSLLKLAREEKAVPVFIGVVLEHIPKNGQSEVLCGDEFIVKYTGLISIED